MAAWLSRLRTLIARHIRDGGPVGSQTLARHSGLDVSPATIRNILADLEDQGLLSAPHTSAGRIPTAQGYRVFVDSLLQVQPLPNAEMARLRGELAGGSGTTQSLLGSASGLVLADLPWNWLTLTGSYSGSGAITDGGWVWVTGAEHSSKARMKALVTERVGKGVTWCPFHFAGWFEGEVEAHGIELGSVKERPFSEIWQDQRSTLLNGLRRRKELLEDAARPAGLGVLARRREERGRGQSPRRSCDRSPPPA